MMVATESSNQISALYYFFEGKTAVMGQDQSCPTWAKSSRCAGNGSCVEVATNLPGERVGVRDGKDLASEEFLIFPRGAWEGFLSDITAGKFSVS